MKLLYAASTVRHLNDFHTSVILGLTEMGYEMYIACRGASSFQHECNRVEIPFAKKYFSKENFRAFFRLRSLIKRENIDIVSTHTALAGFVTRMAVKTIRPKNRPYCIHTAHGYLFGKSSLMSARFTYFFERLCKSVTNLIMTMNSEDNHHAQKLVKNDSRVVAIRGMGVDTSRYFPAERGEKEKLCERLNLPYGILLFCAAEFSRRKNHETLIRAMPVILREIPNAYLVLAGNGELVGEMLRLAFRLGIEENVIFLGYLKDTAPYLRACDIAVSASFSEGLPIGVSEAIACGLPVAASEVKGHTDLLPLNLLFNPRSHAQAARLCIEIARDLINYSGGGMSFALHNELGGVHPGRVVSREEATKEILEIYSK
jgi:glycosyltransferase EpsD